MQPLHQILTISVNKKIIQILTFFLNIYIIYIIYIILMHPDMKLCFK